MNLNEEQKQAVNHLNGCCVVIANAGSGKTRVLTQRVVKLIGLGISPANILCLTFTNKAADEMKSRIFSQSKINEEVWVSTFHKLCVAILRKYGHKIGLDQNFSILTDNDQNDLVRKLFRMHEIESTSKEASFLLNKINSFREDLTPMTTFLEELKEHESCNAHIYPEITEEYLNMLDEYHVVDFSGILYKCHMLLNKHPEVVKALSNKFRHILVDEWQDTNTIQYEIIKKIAKENNNLFAVGDKNQSLYSWRQARPENLDKLFDDFPGTKKIMLPKNYRSTSNILRAAQNLIRNNENCEDVYLESVRGEGEDIRVYQFENPDAEANFVCSKIRQMVENGNDYGDFAVLYRTNALSKLIEQKCRYYDIPYKIIGGFSFYDRKEIKDILAYLTLCVNPYDSIAFHRAISFPKRGIGDVAIGKIERACQNEKMNVFDIAEQKIDDLDLSIKGKNALKQFCDLYKKISASDLTQTTKMLLNESGYLDSLAKMDMETYANKKENLSEFIASVSQFGGNKKTAIQEFLQYVSLQNLEKNDDTDKVKLMTVHSSKGLEFPVTWVIGVEELLFPHYLSLINEEENIDEERRIFFVAITRCQNQLFVTHNKTRQKFSLDSKKNNMIINCKPSRFINEMYHEL